MLRVISQCILTTNEEMCASFIDWQKVFHSLNGPDCYRSQMKLVVTGVTENRVAICEWNRI
jgi:hypothetical protein